MNASISTRDAHPVALPAEAAEEPSASGSLSAAALLGALSHALDLTEGQPAGHCKRCCWIGTRIGIAYGLGRLSVSAAP